MQRKIITESKEDLSSLSGLYKSIKAATIDVKFSRGESKQTKSNLDVIIIKNKFHPRANEYNLLHKKNIYSPFLQPPIWHAINGDNITERGKHDLTYLRDHLTIDDNAIQFIFAQTVLGIHTLHKNNLAHRDIKPENIIFFELGHGQYHIRLIDFNDLVELNDQGQPLSQTDFSGTTYYKAPEVDQSKKNLPEYQKLDMKAADCYSLGILLFMLLLKNKITSEFSSLSIYTRYKINEQYNKFNSSNWKGYHEAIEYFLGWIKEDKEKRIAFNLITSLLDKDPTKRPKIHEIMQHAYFGSDPAKLFFELKQTHIQELYIDGFLISIPTMAKPNSDFYLYSENDKYIDIEKSNLTSIRQMIKYISNDIYTMKESKTHSLYYAHLAEKSTLLKLNALGVDLSKNVKIKTLSTEENNKEKEKENEQKSNIQIEIEIERYQHELENEIELEKQVIPFLNKRANDLFSKKTEEKTSYNPRLFYGLTKTQILKNLIDDCVSKKISPRLFFSRAHKLNQSAPLDDLTFHQTAKDFFIGTNLQYEDWRLKINIVSESDLKTIKCVL